MTAARSAQSSWYILSGRHVAKPAANAQIFTPISILSDCRQTANWQFPMTGKKALPKK
jgi:hypothetical protein